MNALNMKQEKKMKVRTEFNLEEERDLNLLIEYFKLIKENLNEKPSRKNRRKNNGK